MASSQHKSSRKREKRTRAALPVRVNFMDNGFSEQACTLNITTKGARIAGLSRSPSVGDFIEIQRGTKRNIFRVVWAGDQGGRAEGQIGVVCENETIRIWEAELLKGQGFEPMEQLPESLPEPLARPAQKVAPSRRQKAADEVERRGPPAILLVAGSLLFLAVGFLLGRQSHTPTATAAVSITAPHSPIDPRDAAQIHDLQQWRVVDDGDFGPNGISWMKNLGIDPAGIINFHATSEPATAYIFASTDPTSALKRRVMVFINHELHYDTSMPQIFAFAVVPSDELTQITWQAGSRAVSPTGDALMVIRDGNDPSSGVIFEVTGTRVVPREPANFHSISLQSQ
jgi:hypothetical protein